MRCLWGQGVIAHLVPPVEAVGLAVGLGFVFVDRAVSFGVAVEGHAPGFDLDDHVDPGGVAAHHVDLRALALPGVLHRHLRSQKAPLPRAQVLHQNLLSHINRINKRK